MNRKLVIGIVAALIIVAGGYYYFQSMKKEEIIDVERGIVASDYQLVKENPAESAKQYLKCWNVETKTMFSTSPAVCALHYQVPNQPQWLMGANIRKTELIERLNQEIKDKSKVDEIISKIRFRDAMM